MSEKDVIKEAAELGADVQRAIDLIPEGQALDSIEATNHVRVRQSQWSGAGTLELGMLRIMVRTIDNKNVLRTYVLFDEVLRLISAHGPPETPVVLGNARGVNIRRDPR